MLAPQHTLEGCACLRFMVEQSREQIWEAEKAQGSATEKDPSATYTRRATRRGDTSRVRTPPCFGNTMPRDGQWSLAPARQPHALQLRDARLQDGPSLLAVSPARCSGSEIGVQPPTRHSWSSSHGKAVTPG